MTRFEIPVRRFALPIQDFANEMENMVDRMFQRSTCGSEKDEGCSATYSPNVDFAESETAYALYVDLPGIPAGEVKLEAFEDKLSISGNRKHVSLSEGTTFKRQESQHGAFSRTFVLPKNADLDKIDAKQNDGVLTVTIPKVPKAMPRSIEIKTTSV